jgi:hypothetical protein
MTTRRKVDASKVVEAVESGRLSKTVMDGYGLEKRDAAKLKKERKRRGSQDNESMGEVTISKHGSLSLSKDLIQKLGFKEDDLFVVRKTKAGILLKPR